MAHLNDKNKYISEPSSELMEEFNFSMASRKHEKK